MATVTTTPSTDPQPVSSSSDGWMDFVDRWCERIGDKLNPIVVKETRQALKSRQFVITFSLLLIAALGWTIVGSILRMPHIYTTPSAQFLMIGYCVVLAGPMLLVVPLAAYRSLEGEIDDGTLELLSITRLGSWQIVLGKLASASLQMVLYLVTLFPCMAYAYTLRGVDLPTTLLVVLILVASALLLTVAALAFAPHARSRAGRIATLLLVIALLLLSGWGIGALVIAMILYGNPLEARWMVFFVVFFLLLAFSVGHLLLTATAAQLTPPSENRSTPVRYSLLLLTGVIAGLAFYAMEMESIDPNSRDQIGIGVFMCSIMAIVAIWTVCGSMIVAESSNITPRIRRELPNSFLARVCLTFVTPGPATGLVFVTTVSVVLACCIYAGFYYLISIQAARFGMPPAGAMTMLTQFIVLYTSYIIAFFVCVRVLIGLLRIKNNPRVEVGIAGLIAVAVFSALVPYSIGLHLNDYRQFEYSLWQLPNWAWTLTEVTEGNSLNGEQYWVAAVAAGMFLACLMNMGNVVLPRRIATPKRVVEERSKNKQSR